MKRVSLSCHCTLNINLQWPNIIGVSEREEKKGTEKYLKKGMVKIFPHMKNTITHR